MTAERVDKVSKTVPARRKHATQGVSLEVLDLRTHCRREAKSCRKEKPRVI